MHVIVTNDINWHRENLRSGRGKTGNLKRQFEWIPFSFICWVARKAPCSTWYTRYMRLSIGPLTRAGSIWQEVGGNPIPISLIDN